MSALASSLGLLALVLVAIPIVLWCVKRLQSLGPRPQGQLLSLQAQLALGPRERVLLVRAGERLLVLGSTAQQVSLLCELSPERQEAPADPAPAQAAPARDFMRRLQALARQAPAARSEPAPSSFALSNEIPR